MERDRDWDTMGLGLNGTGTQWDEGTMGWKETGIRIQWDRGTMGQGLNERTPFKTGGRKN